MDESILSKIKDYEDLELFQIELVQHKNLRRKNRKKFKKAIKELKLTIEEKVKYNNGLIDVKKNYISHNKQLKSKIDYEMFNVSDIENESDFNNVIDYIVKDLTIIVSETNEEKLKQDINYMINLLKEGLVYSEEEFLNIKKTLNNIYNNKEIDHIEKLKTYIDTILLIISIRENIVEINNIDKNIASSLKEIKENRNYLLSLKYLLVLSKVKNKEIKYLIKKAIQIRARKTLKVYFGNNYSRTEQTQNISSSNQTEGITEQAQNISSGNQTEETNETKDKLSKKSTKKINNQIIIKRIINNIDVIKNDYKNISRISQIINISKPTLSRRFKDIQYFVTPLAQELQKFLFDYEIENFSYYLSNKIEKYVKKLKTKNCQYNDNLGY